MKSVNIQFGTAAQFAGLRGGKNGWLFVNSVTNRLNVINAAGAVFHLNDSTNNPCTFAAGE